MIRALLGLVLCGTAVVLVVLGVHWWPILFAGAGAAVVTDNTFRLRRRRADLRRVRLERAAALAAHDQARAALEAIDRRNRNGHG